MLAQIVKFCVGGGAGVLVFYLVLYTLTEWVGIWYLASAIVASVLNYGLNFLILKFWAFRNTDKKAIPLQAIQYFGMAAGLFFTNTALLYSLVEYLHLRYLVAQLGLTIALSAVSFAVSRWIFRPARPQPR